MYPELKNHRLNTLAKKLDIELTQHHRAIYDAEATGYILLKMLKDAAEKGIEYHDQLNDHMGKEMPINAQDLIIVHCLHKRMWV